MKHYCDFLVIGSGIAGLSYALKVAPYGKVIVITKSSIDETSTHYAQGGIAAVMYNPDTYEKHIKDTIIAGAGLNNEKIVRITIEESTESIKELINLGANFDKNTDGEYDLAKEGGHSEKRIFHHKDTTGAEIQRALSEQIKSHPNITVLENYFTIEIITEHHLGINITRRSPSVTCFGAYILNPKTNKVETFISKITLLATGGSGNVYGVTTNPEVATGDGIAIVYRAKGPVENMEFVQFHPTAFYNPTEKPAFLITEALRGAGAILKTYNGKEFMQKYDKRLSLAPRDIVARAIDNEMKISGADHVYLDASHIGKKKLLEHFPNIYAHCLSNGIDIARDMIPVVPAAHYQCGGIKVDEFGRNKIKNLYATGEVACTGLHGANRLASNSLLEAVVFSNRAAIHSIKAIKNIEYNNDVPVWDSEGTVLNEEMVLITQTRKELNSIMGSYVGIVRSNLRLKRAFDRLKILYEETEDLYKKSVVTKEICELRNMIAVGYLIIKMATERKESRGLHYSIDYPPEAE
ncbi:MAG: L-aspartate oxidase [Bacteroidales bacterium]|jgi:L-aspartate oxidase|nr:L-aspartate oxidase [Bacteroidales bacterium]